MFRRVNSSMGQYEAYAMGNVTKGKWGYATNRMPLWIKPDKKISAHDAMELMRDHYEGTKMDMNHDIGAGPFDCPYRWRPMYWTTDSVSYFVNERAVSTQQTGFVFVAQSRSWLPDPVGGIFWFGVDDTFTTVFSPMYCGITKVPHSFAEGNGSMVEYSPTSAFWTFNWVANWAYTRYNDMIKDIQKVQRELELGFMDQTAKVDKEAAAMYKSDKNKARIYLTNYSVKTGDGTVARWKKLGEYLLVKYMDGNIKKEKDGKFQTNGTGQAVMPSQPGYPKWWLNEIIREHGDAVKSLKVE
jgi:dipeptidase